MIRRIAVHNDCRPIRRGGRQIAQRTALSLPEHDPERVVLSRGQGDGRGVREVGERGDQVGVLAGLARVGLAADPEE